MFDSEEGLRRLAIGFDDARDLQRKQILRHYVIVRELLAPILDSINDEERRDYYEKNKEQFMIPGKVALSEAFFSFDCCFAESGDTYAALLKAISVV
ncbi:MAG TPA: hypothetical protein VNO70_04805 [Blastocatellia bacterium]|nr:hypothetical protein [Blastocatellia bacterium]